MSQAETHPNNPTTSFAQRLWWGMITTALLPVLCALCALALLLALVPITPTRTAHGNLRQRLGCSLWQALWRTWRLYIHYALYALEVVVYWPLGALVEINRGAYFAFLDEVDGCFSLHERRRGILFLGGHYGVIEQIGGTTNEWLVSRGHAPIAVLAKPGRVALFTAMMDAYRRWRGFSVIWTSGRGHNLVTRMSQAVESGSSLGLIVDQKPSRDGAFFEFFGAPAAFPYGGIAFGNERNMPCLATTARRLLPGWFWLEYALMTNATSDQQPPQEVARLLDRATVPFEPARHVETGPAAEATDTESAQRRRRGPDDQSLRVLGQFVGWLEAVIRKDPTQWSWDYKKWSRRLR